MDDEVYASATGVALLTNKLSKAALARPPVSAELKAAAIQLRPDMAGVVALLQQQIANRSNPPAGVGADSIPTDELAGLRNAVSVMVSQGEAVIVASIKTAKGEPSASTALAARLNTFTGTLKGVLDAQAQFDRIKGKGKAVLAATIKVRDGTGQFVKNAVELTNASLELTRLVEKRVCAFVTSPSAQSRALDLAKKVRLAAKALIVAGKTLMRDPSADTQPRTQAASELGASISELLKLLKDPPVGTGASAADSSAGGSGAVAGGAVVGGAVMGGVAVGAAAAAVAASGGEASPAPSPVPSPVAEPSPETEPSREDEASSPVDPRSRPQPVPEPEPEPEPQTEPQPQALPTPELEPQPQAQPQPEPVVATPAPGDMVAKFAFFAESSDELTFPAGARITDVVATANPAWMRGMYDGKTGIFPSNWVEAVEAGAGSQAGGGAVTGAANGGAGASAAASSSGSASAAGSEPAPKRKVKAKFMFVAEAADELTFDQGDIIDDVVEIDSEWMEGTFKGKRGIFPQAFVEDVPVEAPAPAKPAVPESNVRARALFNFTAQAADELAFYKGDVIENVLTTDDEQWWFGKCGRNDGIFPAGFVELLPEESEDAASSSIGKAKHKIGAKGSGNARGVALYDFEAESPDEVSFKAGAVITNIAFTRSEEWWRGIVNGREGLFPSDFVELTEDDAADMPAYVKRLVG
ncbi:uncharacterized protein AMSG_05403 [Thecamonas trahens ATCC 50062]|uniref:SH3 domain-containing protein n=1 Tax=Thecamonas trahens ATCC 50062 TaxID=461836 RepID=A0A0L0DAY7_THETB|nr:hypothetical protein AMSG_05403 [Thecamonas trahens ATCC 50062]KNC49400.1 hypothetical protein AMSG_05403 [Thecamonas trahens ATCC 50062]|eukprot:XP_013757824.1 hypothetical protein AMSG_05403 [Thecamonas trahens ATCC 50062]